MNVKEAEIDISASFTSVDIIVTVLFLFAQ